MSYKNRAELKLKEIQESLEAEKATRTLDPKEEILLKALQEGKVDLGPCDLVEQLQPFVDQILDLLGEPGVWISDIATIDTFFTTEEDSEVGASHLSAVLGFDVQPTDTIVQVAEKLRHSKLN